MRDDLSLLNEIRWRLCDARNLFNKIPTSRLGRRLNGGADFFGDIFIVEIAA
jgi:hypothetical protein